MERRYQVFISSTFVDLIDERREIIEALLEMDAIPAGMELFAAGNTDQWTLIQQVIEQSDYYLVVVGGRYGSMTAEGISYTEMEYDYAVEKEIPVMGFVHADPNTIPVGKSELDPEARAKLDAFREKVKQKMVKQYSTPAELGGVVSRGLIKLQRDFPRPGWVRGDLAMTPETEARIAELRAEVAELRQVAAERNEVSAAPRIEGLASGDDHYQLKINVTGKSTADKNLSEYRRKSWIWRLGFDTTWNDMLEHVGPLLLDEGSETEVAASLTGLGFELSREQPENWSSQIDTVAKREVDDSSVNDVIVQFFALDLIARGVKKRTQSNPNRYWVLTEAGRDQVMRLRAVRRPSPAALKAQRRKTLTKMTVPQLRKLATETHLLDGKGRKQELIDSILTAEGPGTNT